MTRESKTGREFSTAGQKYRRSRQFVEAGDQYTFATYAGLAESEFQTMRHISSAIYWLLCAGLCYRMADQMDRCHNRSRQGVLIAQDLRDGAFQDDALRGLRDETDALEGLSYEYIGDFRILGSLGNHEKAYDRAAACYDRVDDHLAWNSELEFTEPLLFVTNLVEYLGYPVDSELVDAAESTSLHARLEFKQATLPDVLEQVCDAGHWSPEREDTDGGVS